MATYRIEFHVLAWNPSSNKGIIKLNLSNGETKTIEADGSDFAAIGTILREPEIYYDDNGAIFTTVGAPNPP